MMIEEFEVLCGCDVDEAMYYEEVEPVYIEFDWLRKQELAAMYMGAKKGAYALWMRARDLAKEHEILRGACLRLRESGMAISANALMNYWDARAEELKEDVKALIR